MCPTERSVEAQRLLLYAQCTVPLFYPFSTVLTPFSVQILPGADVLSRIDELGTVQILATVPVGSCALVKPPIGRWSSKCMNYNSMTPDNIHWAPFRTISVRPIDH